MPVCYFDSNYDIKYDCEYELQDGVIEITVNYDITEEVEAINGVRSFGTNTEFNLKDIVVIDFHSKKNYLAKQAYFAGINQVYGSPDGGAKTKFRTSTFFEHRDVEKLCDLPVVPKVSKIKVFSKTILDWIGCPSLEMVTTDEMLEIKLTKTNKGSCVPLNCNYIKEITVSDNWHSLHSPKGRNISIDFSGYIELELMRRVNYDKVAEFINELLIYVQLYCPDKFLIEKISVMVNGTYYTISIPVMGIKHVEKHVRRSVDDNLLDFLRKCYTSVPYRNSKADIRNIPYVVLKTSRSIEDNFLTFYRFIECYYKKARSDVRRNFISCGMLEHYSDKHNLSEDQVEKYAQEIICLRNHYVHSGYYIKNGSLRISFGKADPRNYTAAIDIDWIYDRAVILYQITIDIIFSNMLGYTTHQFSKHF